MDLIVCDGELGAATGPDSAVNEADDVIVIQLDIRRALDDDTVRLPVVNDGVGNPAATHQRIFPLDGRLVRRLL